MYDYILFLIGGQRLAIVEKSITQPGHSLLGVSS